MSLNNHVIGRTLSLMCVSALLSSPAWAACGWAAGADLDPPSAHASGAVKAKWNPAPTSPSCAPFTLDHYRVVVKDGSVPTSTTDGIIVNFWPASCPGAGMCTVDVPTERADRTYYMKVYACDDLNCTDVYGDDAEGAPSGTSSASYTTATELWKVIAKPYGDTVKGVVLGAGYDNPAAFFIPSGWATSPGKLALYFDNGSYIDELVATGTGWINWNTSGMAGDYSGRASAPDLGDSDFDSVKDSWPMPVYWGGTEMVYLPAVNDSNSQVVSGGSTGANSYTFPTNLGDWSTGLVDICANGLIDCNYLTEARSGSILWDYLGITPFPNMDTISSPIWETFEGQMDSDYCGPYDAADPDLYLAQWVAEHVVDTETIPGMWVVATDGDCPAEFINDAHSPTSIPLGNVNKIYSTSSITNAPQLHYYEGSTGLETSTGAAVNFVFNDMVTIDPDCVSNMAGITQVVAGPVRKQGMFFYGEQEGVGACGAGHGFSQPGIYYAELVN